MEDRNNPEYKFTCTKCKVEKPNSEFSKRNEDRRIRKYFSSCKECEYKRVGKWQATSEQRKIYKLKYFFNLSHERYLEILKEQNYKCYICGIKEEDCDRKLAIDHNHTTGKVRGLLCGTCNKGLGLFKDNKELLNKAIKYLDKDEHI